MSLKVVSQILSPWINHHSLVRFVAWRQLWDFTSAMKPKNKRNIIPWLLIMSCSRASLSMFIGIEISNTPRRHHHKLTPRWAVVRNKISLSRNSFNPHFLARNKLTRVDIKIELVVNSMIIHSRIIMRRGGKKNRSSGCFDTDKVLMN